jgi:hypothetical protein
MPVASRAIVLIAVMAWPASASAERATRTSQATVACVNWAAWREFGQASLTARGARMGELCPIRIPARERVIVVDADAGAGASEIRHRGKIWFVDAQALD